MSVPANLNLSPFRRRIRLVCVWRGAAVGGCLGAAGSVVLAALDYFGVWDAAPTRLAVPLGLGIVAGMGHALTQRLPESTVARSVDRRGGLADRLTSASEVPAATSPLAYSLLGDAQGKAETLKPAVLYPLRLGRWHGVLLALAALCALVFLLGNTTLFRGRQAKQDAAELRRDAAQVQRVARPALEDAKRADAAPQDKDLARQLNRFTSDLRKGRMTKAQALVKANQLAQQAQALQSGRAAALAQSIQSAQTASQKLEAMQSQASLPKSDAAKAADQARALSGQIAAMQQALSAAQSGKMSASAKAALSKKLAQAQKQLQQIRLSQQAEQFLQKLQSMPDYQEAQKLLAKLAAQAQAQQAGQPPPLTPEQMQQIADRMEQLAKQFGSDAKMRELAAQMLVAARNAQLCKNPGLGAGLMGAFGLGAGSGMGGLSLGLGHGAGGPSPDKWVGDHGTLSRSDKSALLHVKFQDRQITSQIGGKGPETYTEVIGPSAPAGKSGVPYQAVLPRYEKSAESALDKGDVPPQMRTKVRDYFDSLRK